MALTADFLHEPIRFQYSLGPRLLASYSSLYTTVGDNIDRGETENGDGRIFSGVFQHQILKVVW